MEKYHTNGKLTFKSRGEAYQHLNRHLRGKNLRIYECQCGKYHFTHTKHKRK